MPMITLSRKWESQVMDKTKVRTTRFNTPYYLKLAGFSDDTTPSIDAIMDGAEVGPVNLRARKGRLKMWLGTPRAKHRLPWVRKLGESSERYEFDVVMGRDFTEEMAVQDGFGTAREFKEGLMELHGLTMSGVEGHIWTSFVIDWAEGPHAV